MNPACTQDRIAPMSDTDINKVRRLEALLLTAPQVDIHTSHVIHGGMYARTIRIPAGVVLTGALIKIPTLLIINGHVTVFINGVGVSINGYHVLAASAGRKQVFVAHEDTDVTMCFPTSATCIEDIEAQFTDEADMLFSRRGESVDSVIITGE